MPLTTKQKEVCANPPADYSDLKACFINTTLKPASEPSHTEALMSVVIDIMKQNGVGVTYLRAADYDIALGIRPDMRNFGAEKDDWPEKIWPAVKEADILVIGTPLP